MRGKAGCDEMTTTVAMRSIMFYDSYTVRMTTPVPTRFTDDELALIDELVDSGIAENRSAVIRRGVHDLAESVRRARVGATIAASYRELPQTHEDDEFAMASAIAMTEAEPW